MPGTKVGIIRNIAQKRVVFGNFEKCIWCIIICIMHTPVYYIFQSRVTLLLNYCIWTQNLRCYLQRGQSDHCVIYDWHHNCFQLSTGDSLHTWILSESATAWSTVKRPSGFTEAWMLACRTNWRQAMSPRWRIDFLTVYVLATVFSTPSFPNFPQPLTKAPNPTPLIMSPFHPLC